MRDLISPIEAADLTGLTLEQLRRLRRKGGGPPFVRLGHRTVRYVRGGTLRWLIGRIQLSTRDAA
jgi:predicted DNA-binding transcriptional regulator AlpA